MQTTDPRRTPRPDSDARTPKPDAAARPRPAGCYPAGVMSLSVPLFVIWL